MHLGLDLLHLPRQLFQLAHTPIQQLPIRLWQRQPTQPPQSLLRPQPVAVDPGLVRQVAVDPVAHRRAPTHQALTQGHQPAHLPPPQRRLVGQRQLPGQELALDTGGIDFVGLAAPRLGR